MKALIIITALLLGGCSSSPHDTGFGTPNCNADEVVRGHDCVKK
jgi:uncharacterized lipoprotein YmbA